jgi:hypothetical protein
LYAPKMWPTKLQTLEYIVKKKKSTLCDKNWLRS